MNEHNHQAGDGPDYEGCPACIAHDDERAVRAAAAEIYKPEGVEIWMNAPNRSLNNATPMQYTRLFWTALEYYAEQCVYEIRKAGDEPESAEIRFTPEALARYARYLPDLFKLGRLATVPVSFPEEPAPAPMPGAGMFLTMMGERWRIARYVMP